ncbi:hypothetical protein BC829DRAFT_147026 [Chytridium lagenaria]|nr:hypothetical protein BC829DRAFT_147026 [Chytridium lagenaria]
MPTAGMAGRPSRTATLSMPQGSKRVPLQKHGTAAGGHSPAERPSHAGEINSGSCLEKRDIGEKEKAQAPHPSHTGLLPSLVCPAVPESVRRRKSITAALNNQSARLNSANPAATASPLSGMLEGTSITAETPPPRPFQMGTHHRRHDEGFSFNAGAREGRNHSFSGASSNKYGLAGESKIMKIVLPRLPPVDAVELTTSPPAPHEQQFDAIELPFDPANTSGNVRKRSMSVDRAGSSTPASEPQSFPGSRPRTGRSHSVHEVEKCQLPKLNADERLTSNKSRSKSRASPSLPKVGGAQNSSDHDEDNDERCEHGKANKSTHVCPHHRSHSQRLVAMSFSDLDAILDAEKRIAALQEVAVDDSSKKSRPPSRYRSQPSLPTGGQSPGSPNRLRRVLGYLSHPDFLNFNDLNALADAMSLEAFQRVAPHVTKIKGSWKMRWEKELKERGIRDMIKPNRPPSSSNVSNAKERKKPERRGTNSSDKLGGKTATPSCRVEEHDYETGQATLESSKSNETDIGKNVPENESGCIGDGCVPLDPRLTDYCVKGGSIGDVPLNSVATSITFKASASWNAKLSKAVKIQLANAVDSGCATQSVEIPPGLDSTQTRLNDNTLESSQDAQYKNSDDKSSNTLTQEAELMYDEKWRDDGEHGIPQVPHGTESGEGILQSGQHSSIQSAGTPCPV